jgi:hypothetical protein
MFKRVTFVFLVLTVILAAPLRIFTIPLYAAENLVQNSTFTQKLDNWVTYGLATADTHQIDGNNRARIIVTKNSYTSGISQRVDVESGKTYSLSGEIKVGNLDTHGGSLIRIAWYENEDSGQLSTIDSTVAITQDDWQTLTGEITAPSGATRAEIRLTAKTSGDSTFVFFDNITFVQNEETNSDPPPTNSQAPDGTITLTEVSPTTGPGEKEWVEFYNSNNFAVSLDGWYIKDASGNKKNIANIILAPGSYGIFSFSSGYLNDSGDKVELYYQDTRRINLVYPSIKKGYTWAGIYGQWCLADPSPGSGNPGCVSVEPDPTPTPEPTSTPEPTALAATPVPVALKTSPRPTPKPEITPEYDRKAPNLDPGQVDADTNGQVAGASTQSVSSRPSLLIPAIIASSGMFIMAGVSFPYWKPKLAVALSKIKRG